MRRMLIFAMEPAARSNDQRRCHDAPRERSDCNCNTSDRSVHRRSNYCCRLRSPTRNHRHCRWSGYEGKINVALGLIAVHATTKKNGGKSRGCQGKEVVASYASRFLTQRGGPESEQIPLQPVQSDSIDLKAQAHCSLCLATEFLVCEVYVSLWTPTHKADTHSRCGQMPRKLSQNACRFLQNHL